MSHERYRDGEIVISTDPARQDVDGIHAFLTRCYWAEGIPKEIVARSVRHSLCFGVFDGPAQVGFARVISDYSTYAYIGDVYILDSHRGRGLSKRLMQCIMEHEDLQGLRRWSLLTRDAHGLYRQFGFTDVARPERYMEIAPRNIYKR
jgi:GNAT superfamily N-acetyltransferase